MRPLKLSNMATGAVLFVLDVGLVLLAWPLVLCMMDPGFDLYPAADLLALYAMGLYRREALLDTGRSLTRVPLVVGMGAALAVLGCMAVPFVTAAAPTHGGREHAQTFALAAVCFTLCAFLARL